MSKQPVVEPRLESVGHSVVPTANPLIVALAAWDLVTVRTYNCLVATTRWFEAGDGPGGIAIEDLRLSDVAVISAREMLRVPNFGRRCYYDLYAVMRMFGWPWGDLPRSESEKEQREREAALASRARVTAQRRDALERASRLKDLHDLEGLTCHDIAARLGMSEGLVQRKIAEVRKVEELRLRYAAEMRDQGLGGLVERWNRER